MLRRLAIGMCIFAAVGCSEDSNTEPANDNNTTSNGKGDQIAGETVCAAIRGNGELVTAHFGSLARIVEHYGPIDAASGGSSASISTFMLASIQANPLLTDCGEDSCTLLQTRNREALLLKSFQGYIEFLSQTDEAVAIQSALPIVKEIQEAGIEEMAAEDVDAAAQALTSILESEKIASLVNPELVGLLTSSPNPAYHVNDIVASIKSFGSFDAEDPKILVRPGLLNFSGLADQLSMTASFYAGYGEYDTAAVLGWLNNCADASRGMTWSELRGLPSGEATCATQFYGILGAYRAAYEANPDAPSRGDDMIGTYMPALISTSVLTGDALDGWKAAKAQYFAGEEPELTVNFDDVKFGYFGDAESLATLESKTMNRGDLKSQKAMSLGTVTWREALSVSPAEPGLSRAIELDANYASAGGWPDLHPVMVLKDMGCENVIYVTRTDPESGFARGVAALLGMQPADDDSLYNLMNPESSFAQSVAQADGVWCTNWNAFGGADVEAIIQDSYNARLFSASKYLQGAGGYENLSSEEGVTGCSL